MSRGKQALALALVLVLMAVLMIAMPLPAGTEAQAEEQPIYPASDNQNYYELSDIDLGIIRQWWNCANQPTGEWDGFDNFYAYRYELGFMSYAAALMQQRLPAYRQALQDTQNGLVRKMIEPEVWDYWQNISWWPGGKGGTDPVGYENIMYSGHLGNMIGLIELLYGDFRWDQDFVLVPENGDESQGYHYDFQKIAERFKEQMESGEFNCPGIPCEPPAVFVQCNEHAVATLKLYDLTHGTDYSRVAFEEWLPWVSENFVNPMNGLFHVLYVWPLKVFIPIPAGSNDGWILAFMNAEDPALFERVYPKFVESYGFRLPDGTMNFSGSLTNIGGVRIPMACPQLVSMMVDAESFIDALGSSPGLVLDNSWSDGFALTIAKEKGDSEVADAVQAYIDKYYTGSWENGGFSYDNFDLLTVLSLGLIPSGLAPFYVMKLATHTFEMGRCNVKDGMKSVMLDGKLNYDPEDPYLESVPYPTVYVRKAYYDKASDTLEFKLAADAAHNPNAASLQSNNNVNVTLANLTPDKLYEIWIGGTKCGEFKAGEDGKANVSVPALNEPEIEIKGMKDVAKEPVVESGTSCYFAEGCTREGFNEYLTLQNPGDNASPTTITYMLDGGEEKIQPLLLAPHSRITVDVGAVVGPGRDVSAEVTSELPIVAERPMYFNYNNAWAGGDVAMGAASPQTEWHFAEGCTREGFDEYICVLNPGDSAADLTFTFQTQEAGEQVKTGYSVGPHARATFKVNDVLGSGYQTSLKLSSIQPVVAERPMYFNYQGVWDGGSCVMGAPSLAKQYYFAEGTTRAGFDEYLTLQNPGTSKITVNAVYQFGPGQGDPINKTYEIDPGKRATVFVASEVGTGKDVSVKLSSSSDFLAERPMYFNYNNAWAGGDVAMGAAAPQTEWRFAEGCTRAGFDEYLTLQNPGDVPSPATVTYMLDGGEERVQPLLLPAHSRITVDVGAFVGPGRDVSAVVTSDLPIVAERPMYFNYNGVWAGGDVVMGAAAAE